MEYSEESKESITNRLLDKLERIFDKAERCGIDLRAQSYNMKVDTIFDTSSMDAFVRDKRNHLLDETDKIMLRHKEEQEFGLNRTMSALQYSLFLRYRNLLRKIPEQPGFPNKVEWPEKPKL